MLISELASWTCIELKSTSNRDKILKSRIVERLENEIHVTEPLGTDERIDIDYGGIIKVAYNKGDAVIEWICTYGGTTRLKGVVIHKLLCSTKGVLVNRRESYRVPLKIETELSSKHVEEKCKGILKDISYTGVGFVSETEFKLEDIISFKLIWESYRIGIKTRVVRSSLTDDKQYEYGGIIVDMDSDKLGKLLYDLQIKNLRCD